MIQSSGSMFSSRVRLFVIGVIVALSCAGFGAAFTSETAFAAEPTNTATLSVSGTNNQTEAREILAMVNAARAATTNVTTGATKAPGAALTWDYELEKVAIQRAAEISVYYSHTRPDGTDCFTAFPEDYYGYGENIQASSGSMTVSQANQGWTKSPGHYTNMINDGFTCMAAASFRVNGATYWVELFATPNSGAAATTAVTGTKSYTVKAISSLLDLSFSSKLSAVSAKGSSVQYQVTNTNKGFSYCKTPVSASSFNWTSSNPAAATINANGKATVVGSGGVTITATNKTLSTVKVANTLTLKAPTNSSSASIKEGWQKSGNRWWYGYADGSYAKGLTNIQGAMYFFDNSGWMKTGWQKISNAWYYFAGSGVMKTGWTKVSGKWYYMASDGKMLTGKQTINKKLYFLDKSGAMKMGWVKDGGDWYYCDSSGASTTGWQKIKGTWYYMNSAGIMQTGWFMDGSSRYYLGSSGAMTKGWKQIGSSWYYFNNSGVMKTGWQKVGGKWYLLASDGKMLTGWQKVGTKNYYMNGSGVMQANKWIGNYYVQGDGSMATNKWIGNYHVNADGLWDQTRKATSSSSSSSSSSSASSGSTAKPAIGSTVYWTPSGNKYHSSKGCSTLSKSKTIYSGTVSDAGSRTACQKCF